MRRIARSTAGIRSSVQPWLYVASSSLIAVHLPDDALHELDGVLVQRRLGRPGSARRSRQQRLGVDAALLGLEQDVERALAGLAAGRHQATGLVIS